MNRWLHRTLPVAVVLASCTPTRPPAAPPPPAAAALASPPAPQTQEAAHNLVVAGAGCWLGGLWADALGEKDAEKTAGIESRCRGLEKEIWAGADDAAHYEALRNIEPEAAAEFVAAVDRVAQNDSVDGPRRDALVRFARALALAQRELSIAHRAGDRVKRDLATEPERLNEDEVYAVMPLRTHAKLEDLYKLDAGDLSREAQALALLCALDRLDIARGLPKHLKFYALADEVELLFGVALPDVPEDVLKRLVPGTWLKLLTDTALAAGHPVSDRAMTPRERDTLAWAGILAGFSDLLKAGQPGVAATTDLSRVVATVVQRLDGTGGPRPGVEAKKPGAATAATIQAPR